ncbi:MAG TPA: isoprenylcysteine carboxylmethyltransferase family protein [Candidatus Eremiobacteraeota bacterium]|nr:isoprenylcysteine carboxylmethyltransferase family protein [Candidatus Eremiobacteraeota bacterium]
MESCLTGSLIIFAGEALRIWGVGYAGKTTRSHKVEAPYLVTNGPYAYVKNPLYLGNFLIGTGFSLMASGGVSNLLKIFIIFFFLFSAMLVYGTIVPLEERFLSEKFGTEYIKYNKEVPRFLPFRKSYSDRKGSFSWEPVIKGEINTFIYLGLAYVVLVFKMF